MPHDSEFWTLLDGDERWMRMLESAGIRVQFVGSKRGEPAQNGWVAWWHTHRGEDREGAERGRRSETPWLAVKELLARTKEDSLRIASFITSIAVPQENTGVDRQA